MLVLGELEDVLSVKLSCPDLKLDVNWELPEYNSNSYVHCKIPSALQLLKGDSLELPIILRKEETELKRKWFKLIRSYNGEALENWFDRVTLLRDEDEKTGNHIFKVEGLESGSYMLEYLNGSHPVEISISVTEGDLWPENPSFVLKKHEMTERAQSNRIMHLSKFDIEEIKSETETHKVSVEVSNCSDGVHMALTATSFLGNFEDFYNLVEQYQSVSFSSKVIGFAKWKNMYQSNCSMSDELRYVNDRKKLEAMLGNTLDRPSLLMQKQVYGKTQTD
jgi:hypothetical protein